MDRIVRTLREGILVDPDAWADIVRLLETWTRYGAENGGADAYHWSDGRSWVTMGRTVLDGTRNVYPAPPRSEFAAAAGRLERERARAMAELPGLLDIARVVVNLGDASIRADIAPALRAGERKTLDDAVATARAILERIDGKAGA